MDVVAIVGRMLGRDDIAQVESRADEVIESQLGAQAEMHGGVDVSAGRVACQTPGR